MTTPPGLSADEMLLTTRAVRKRLDFDRPVHESLLRECARFAVQAPTSSNGQGWHFVFVTERSKVEALAAIYRRAQDPNRARFLEASRGEGGTRTRLGGAAGACHRVGDPPGGEHAPLPGDADPLRRRALGGSPVT